MKHTQAYSWTAIAATVFCVQLLMPSVHAAQERGAAAGLEGVHITIHRSDLPLKEILSAVESQTKFTFVFMKDEMPLNERIALAEGGYSLNAILERLSNTLALTFSRVNDRIVVKRTASETAEKAVISGFVRDASTNEPLVFATVIVEGSPYGGSADVNGRFSIDLPSGFYRVRCGFVGYKTETLPVEVHSEAKLSFALTSTDVVLQDVTVYAHRIDEGAQPEVNALTLQSETIKHITSIIPDVMRSVQMLPGVSTNNEFSSRFNVRGGNQDENLVVVNGTQVYDPFHVKEVSNASIGIFNVDMIKKMDLITGGFTARYGDKMSSVLNIEYREGSRTAYSGMASMSLMDLNAVAEGPIGEKGSFIIGGRKSYFEYVMKLLGESAFFHPSFYDVQGVFAYAPSPASKVMVKLIHSGDDFFEDPHREFNQPMEWQGRDNTGLLYTNTQSSSDSSEAHANYYSNMAALQFTHILSSSALIRSEVSLYDQRETENSWRDEIYHYKGVNPRKVYFYDGTWISDYRNSLRIRTIELNTSLDLQLSQLYGIKAGGSYQRIDYMQRMFQSETIDEFTNQYNHPDTTIGRRISNPGDNVQGAIDARSYKAAGFLENIFQLADGLLVNVGARVDYFDLNKDLTWSPRLNVAYRAGAGLVLRAAWGHYYQSPVYRQIAYPVASDTNTQSQHAIHYIAGLDYEVTLGRDAQNFLRVKAEWYRKQYSDLITATVTSQGVVNYSRKNDAEGKAEGIDVQLIYSTPIFYGWISYGYLLARQTVMLNGMQTTFPRYTDQKHTLAMTGEFDLGKLWSLSTRFVYGSGYPYTPAHTAVNPVKRIWEWLPNPMPNSDYLPAYTRADMNVTKQFNLLGIESRIFLEVSNLFNSKNIQAFRYRFDSTGRPYKEEIELWPILPSIGFAVRF